ncbi:hypothetical protein BKP35_11435 [Anaerobacillus arseniciselenatis]|uniref:Citrate transporter-like domain-containing protein n=1 Tax=Anaerobacillus arseniciselenatis TaxID=85682 RepID=A0A1S2LGX1_9BACI|nr:hypothetical protein [Anaerobacillus arseniciselenatis]OIJ11554.1 hypothetical protein BKP35_11435 [Anaerobacillus arseniciselenatis]
MLYLYSVLIIAYLFSLFIDWIVLEYSVGVLAIVAFIASFKGAKRLYQVTSTAFLIIGIILFPSTEKHFTEVPFFMTSTMIILAIFFVLPFINSIIVVGRYDKSVNKLLKARVNHLGQLYYRGSIVSFLLGTFLNISTLPLVQNVLHKNLATFTKKLRNIFISRAMLRGYALCLVWSPMEIMVAITIDITGASYLRLLPWLLLFSFLLLFIDWLLGWKYKKYTVDIAQNQAVEINLSLIKKVITMLIYLVIFIVAILSLKEWLQLNFLTAVTLVIVPYSIFWAIAIRRLKSFIKYSIPIWKERTIGLKNYMVLFIAVSFFVTVLNQSGYMLVLQQPLEVLAKQPIFLFFSIQCLFLLLAMIGFHPLVTISILGELLQPLAYTVSPISLSIVLITSSLSTVMAGPYNITVSLTSVLVGENPYRISIWNIGYAMLFSSFGTIFAIILL